MIGTCLRSFRYGVDHLITAKLISNFKIKTDWSGIGNAHFSIKGYNMASSRSYENIFRMKRLASVISGESKNMLKRPQQYNLAFLRQGLAM